MVEPKTGRVTEVREGVVHLGRDPESTVVFSGDEAKVVSGHHAEIRHVNGHWHLVDAGSRNGTYVNGRRVTTETPLQAGDLIGLGESGPKLTVAAVADVVPPTLVEHPAVDAGQPLPFHPEKRAYGVTLLAAATGKRYEARGTRIRLGRGSECEIQPVSASDTIVSRVHAELTVGPTGGLVVRDAESKNGTFVNGERVTDPMPVRLGDKITLGDGGPTLIIEGLGTSPGMPVAPKLAGLGQKTVMALIGDAIAHAKEERRQGRRGSTAFLKAVAEEVGKDSRRKIRWLAAAVAILVLVLGTGVYGVYWLLSTEVQETEVARRTGEDSARAESERLRQELAEARRQAAPAAQVESLRAQLESAQVRTAELRAALDRAQAALSQQLADGEARRGAAQADVQRLRDELTAAERRAPSRATLDSLRRAVATAETRTADLDAKLRAIRGTDFASIAQQTQAAVALVTVALGREYYDGTGFVVTSDGYLLTNWHVVADSSHPRADTIWVTMADQSQARYADVIATSQQRDIALLKIRGYQGPYLAAIDWAGTKARQGEPAALIGFPAGAGFARYRSAVVRTSMTAGIISRVTEDLVQFDGMTIGGSSGSPVLNANGEVISIHRAGLREAPGFALSVPVRHAIPLLPTDLRQRLGLD